MPQAKANILVVDDEESICQLLDIMLTEDGYWVGTAQNVDDALKRLEIEPYDVVIADIMMPKIDGLSLLKDIRKFDPHLPVILITAYASLGSAVEALRQGAFDYITKPFQLDQVRFAVKSALETGKLRRENKILRQVIKQAPDLSRFVGDSKVIKDVRELVRRVSPTQSTVLITGESGTGKELIAHSIHQLSNRAGGKFVTINCAALPETLLESELFGYVKGAFTGADKDKDGLFRTADGGTFFLDEVGETSPAIQAKLLRILETSEFTPLGSTNPVEIDVRLIAATNKDIKKMVDDGRFRGDLYYRLNVIHVHIPPLREHKEDIIQIARIILGIHAAKTDEEPKKLSPKVEEFFKSAKWEGNVRELENVLERSVLLCKRDTIKPEHIPNYLRKETRQSEKSIKTDEHGAAYTEIVKELKIMPIDEIEKAYVFWTLVQTGGNKSEAARKLGIDLSTLYRKIEKYGLKKYLDSI